MTSPLVDGVVQIGIVVRDAAAMARRYEQMLGLGGWNFNEVDTERGLGRRFHSAGRPVEIKALIAWTCLGEVELELIEPRDEDSVYARHLRDSGPGIHHVMFSARDVDNCCDRLAGAGLAETLAGEFQHTRFKLFDATEELGLVLEIASGGPLVPDRHLPD